jgi:hypothetical protein
VRPPIARASTATSSSTGAGGVDVGRPEVGADTEALFGVAGLVFWLAAVVA